MVFLSGLPAVHNLTCVFRLRVELCTCEKGGGYYGRLSFFFISISYPFSIFSSSFQAEMVSMKIWDISTRLSTWFGCAAEYILFLRLQL